jgi:hypothetical protein
MDIAKGINYFFINLYLIQKVVEIHVSSANMLQI